MVACAAWWRTDLAYPPVMSIETGSLEARAMSCGSSSSPGSNDAAGMPCPVGTVGVGPNGT